MSRRQNHRTSLPLNQVVQGDCREILRSFPDDSIDFIMTSPPYWGLRVYKGTETIWGGSEDCEHWWGNAIPRQHEGGGNRGVPEEWKRPSREAHIGEADSFFCSKCGAWKGQLGLEPTYQLYVQHLMEIFREVKRVLKKSGSFYLNMGDTYSGGGWHHSDENWGKRTKGLRTPNRPEPQAKIYDLLPKCLVGVPWRVAFALIDDDWTLRNDIIWNKPNAMPSSVKDRLSCSHEHIFHFVKSRRYYYELDNIREPHGTSTIARITQPTVLEQRGGEKQAEFRRMKESLGGGDLKGPAKVVQRLAREYSKGRLKGKNPGDSISAEGFLDFWSINTQPFKGAHFAVFPAEITVRPILSSCPPDGIVLDPLAGSGTLCWIAKVLNAKQFDRLKLPINDTAKRRPWTLKWIGIEINPDYCEIAKRRLETVPTFARWGEVKSLG